MSILSKASRNWKFVLILILLFASFLRFYNLENLPSGFHNDEASFFLNAQALKLNLHDEDNNFLPLYITSFIDPKPALYSYLQIPFITLFGETTTAARMPAVFLGIISLLLSFFLLKKLFTHDLALIGTFVLAISPWHIMLSRASQEVIMSFTFTLAAILMLFTGLSNKHKKVFFYTFFFIFALLSMYSYHSAKIFLPLLSLVILLYYAFSRHITKKHLALLTLGIAITTFIAIQAGGLARYNAIGIFSSPGVQLIVNERVGAATNHADPLQIRLFNNKVIGYSHEIIKQYGEHFTLNFLFIEGGEPPRYKVPFHGLFYLFEVLLIVFGIAYGLAKEKLRRTTLFFLGWMLLVPIPSALTTLEIPSVIRAFPMIIPLTVFISLGMYAFFAYTQKQYKFIPILLVTFLYLAGFSYFWFQFTVQQPHYHPWERHYGSERLPAEIMKIADKYENVHIGSNQYVYFALSKYISLEELQRSYPMRSQNPSTFGKITFVNDGCRIFPTEKNTLFVIRNGCKDPDKRLFKKVGQVNFKDNNPEYIFYEYRNPANSIKPTL